MGFSNGASASRTFLRIFGLLVGEKHDAMLYANANNLIPHDEDGLTVREIATGNTYEAVKAVTKQGSRKRWRIPWNNKTDVAVPGCVFFCNGIIGILLCPFHRKGDLNLPLRSPAQSKDLDQDTLTGHVEPARIQNPLIAQFLDANIAFDAKQFYKNSGSGSSG